MLFLSPILQDMKMDMAHTITDSIYSLNKELHASINSPPMRLLLTHSDIQTYIHAEIVTNILTAA